MKKKISKIVFILSLNLLAVFILTACSSEKKESPKSMEQIQKEEGVPVTVQPVAVRLFEKDLTFFGKFKGIKETTVGAMIGGRIQKVLVKPGQQVKKDQVIMEFPEDAPASQYKQAKAAYENSHKTYNRMKALYEKGEIAQARFDAVQTKYLVDKRNFETMKEMLKLDAPYDGTVTEIMAHEGDNVKAKVALFTVAKLNRMKIRIWISQDERSLIKKGMTALATVEEKTFSGHVSAVSLSVDPFKQAFYADLIFPNPKGDILPGTTADVKIIIYRNKEAIVLPRNLTRKEGPKYFVFIAENTKARKRYVTVKDESGLFYEVGSGLNPGELLITKGTARLNDGIKIKVVQ